MRREPGSHNDNFRRLDVVNVTKKVCQCQRNIEIGTAVRELVQKTLRFRPTLVVIRRIEALDSIFGRIGGSGIHVTVRIRTCHED
jgi:hypothetical protein